MAELTYSATEAAEVLGVSRPTLYTHLAHRADFPCLWVGKRLLVPKKELTEWLSAQVRQKTEGGVSA